MVKLLRFETSNQGTFGILLINNQFFCYTLELPNKGNKPNISCIPADTYGVKWTYSPAFKRRMYLITNVKERSGIRIHSANFAGDAKKGYKKQLYGCIALGCKIGKLGNQKAVLVSRPTVRKFENLMKKKPFKLQIEWVYGI